MPFNEQDRISLEDLSNRLDRIDRNIHKFAYMIYDSLNTFCSLIEKYNNAVSKKESRKFLFNTILKLSETTLAHIEKYFRKISSLDLSNPREACHLYWVIDDIVVSNKIIERSLRGIYQINK